ncbi:MAG: carboxynorspermidine decarboxylase [Prevotellaceae bacterium]|jgi:carboxynorspermidine decarboxylase|nr:carboxynorspermidine decarboxylase [Prevotellaceae bacterium]
MNYSTIPSPCYVLDEKAFRRNLELIRSVQDRSGVEIILAFKAFAMWSAFPIVREYIPHSTASSLSEARLAFEEMGSKAHTYAPAYTDGDFPGIMAFSSHITFNSLTQYHHFKPEILNVKPEISCGLRINPEYSTVETDLYNPCAPGSRLGVAVELLGEGLPEGVEGLHFHTLCESTSYDLEATLAVVEEKFGKFFPQIKWLNMGGGHLITRKDYDVEHLIKTLQTFKNKYPHLHVILEPGSAFAWQTGVLLSTVIDIVENQGVKTAVLDVSFACHMPDCLEMPYQPDILYQQAGGFVRAKKTDGNLPLAACCSPLIYRMGGNSCLSGDFFASWLFDRPLQVGDRIVFEDMIHYTMVKTTMFNGVTHPGVGIWTKDDNFKLIRSFGYEDFKNRMS